MYIVDSIKQPMNRGPEQFARNKISKQLLVIGLFNINYSLI